MVCDCWDGVGVGAPLAKDGSPDAEGFAAADGTGAGETAAGGSSRSGSLGASPSGSTAQRPRAGFTAPFDDVTDASVATERSVFANWRRCDNPRRVTPFFGAPRLLAVETTQPICGAVDVGATTNCDSGQQKCGRQRRAKLCATRSRICVVCWGMMAFEWDGSTQRHG
jgi:hypothetical protein